MKKQFGRIVGVMLGIVTGVLVGRLIGRSARRRITGFDNFLIAGGVSKQVEICSKLLGLFSFQLLNNTMIRRREFHTATFLGNHKVLLVGGMDSGAVWNVGELYDSDSESFSQITSPMIEERVYHTATHLHNNLVLIAGGESGMHGSTLSTTHNNAELYDNSLNTFTAIPALMPHPLSRHTANWIEHTSGDSFKQAVLLVGGGFGILFDPANVTFENINSPTSIRFDHTATAFFSHVLITGGIDENDMVLNTDELYDFMHNIFTPVASMINSRSEHTSTRLNNGKILIVGGIDNGGNVLNSAELFDTVTNTFQSVSNQMTHPRYRHKAISLWNGDVLIVGGEDAGNALSTAEIFSPATNTFISSVNNLIIPRSRHTVTSIDHFDD